MLDALAAALKVFLYIGILLAAGSVFAQATLKVDGHFTSIAWRLIKVGAIMVASTCVAGALVLIFRLGGQFDSGTLSAIFSSSAGASLFMQITGVALLLASRDDLSANVMRLMGGGLLLLSLGFNGHAASVGLFESLLLAGHVGMAAWWIGCLFLLRHSCRTPGVDTTSLVLRFGSMATFAIGILIVAGLLLIWTMVGFDDFPLLRDYEQRLMIKIGFAASVFAIAAFNKWRLTPRLAIGDAAAATTLRRSIDLELIVIGFVLIATSILTTYTSPHE
ncbi:MAG TPA: CopD family protein [Steroidobacteraceae bacterium]|nr:CopD family protein [Steroidobacteraceae bacterium]